MEKLLLVEPSIRYKEELISYREKFDGQDIYGASNLDKYESIEDWLLYIKKMSNKKTCPDNRVPSNLYLLIREKDNRLIGMTALRHNIEMENLLNYSGHIGYSIRPSERLKGYAKEQLRLCLLKARDLGISKVLVTCSEKNIGSEKTILANGGVYEDKRFDPDERDYLKRYWIDLNE